MWFIHTWNIAFERVFWCLRHHGWTWRALCSGTRARHKKTNIAGSTCAKSWGVPVTLTAGGWCWAGGFMFHGDSFSLSGWKEQVHGGDGGTTRGVFHSTEPYTQKWWTWSILWAFYHNKKTWTKSIKFSWGTAFCVIPYTPALSPRVPWVGSGREQPVTTVWIFITDYIWPGKDVY